MPEKTRYFYDAEFLEDGLTIKLISLGICCDDGREYYAVNRSAPWAQIVEHSWLRENVLPHLPMRDPEDWNRVLDDVLDMEHHAVKWKSDIADEVLAFFLADGRGSGRSSRELWSWYGAYDHVVLCQLWGRMIDLPDGIPMFTCDVKQVSERLGNPSRPSQVSQEHHALADARYTKQMWEHFEVVEAQRLAVASQRADCPSFSEDDAREMLNLMRSGRVHRPAK